MADRRVPVRVRRIPPFGVGSEASSSAVASLLAEMANQHGACATRQSKAHGVSPHVVTRLIREGVLVRANRSVLVARGAPPTWHQQAMIAALSPGCIAISHGAAARLHGLEGFAHHEPVNVIAKKGAWPRLSPPAIAHFTRGLCPTDVTTISSIPVLTVATTLALLSASAGASATRAALESALRNGLEPADARATAERWRSRGRPGPATLIELLDGCVVRPERVRASRRPPSTDRPYDR